jgi:hypothetical protein
MAARFDAKRAKALGQRSGDGTPIMLTIPTDQPWVPIRILSLGLPKTQNVDADVFLLTDEEPKLLAGGPGLELQRSEPANDLLLRDLRSDKGMEWMPSSMWFSYLQLDAKAGALDYDLAVSNTPKVAPAKIDTGVTDTVKIREHHDLERWPIVVGAMGAALAAFLVSGWIGRGRRHTS